MLIQQTWMSFIYGSPAYVWEMRLRKLKPALQNWAKNHFKGQKEPLQETLLKLEQVQEEIEEKYVSPMLLQHATHLNQDLGKHIRDEEEMWWLKL